MDELYNQAISDLNKKFAECKSIKEIETLSEQLIKYLLTII